MVTENEEQKIPDVLQTFLGDGDKGTLAQILQALNELGLKYKVTPVSENRVDLYLTEGDLVPIDQFENKFLGLLRNLGFTNINGSSNPIINYRDYYFSLDYDEWENDCMSLDIIISEKVISNSQGNFVYPFAIQITYEASDNE